MARARGGGVWGRAIGFITPREGRYRGVGAGGSSRDIRGGEGSGTKWDATSKNTKADRRLY